MLRTHEGNLGLSGENKSEFVTALDLIHLTDQISEIARCVTIQYKNHERKFCTCLFTFQLRAAVRNISLACARDLNIIYLQEIKICALS